MRNLQTLNARHRIGGAPSMSMERVVVPNGMAPKYQITTVTNALDGLREVIAEQCGSRSGQVTRDGIMAYALALLRLRDCASAAGFGRLTNACDAIAVTVSRLIEENGCASHNKCEVLMRFIAHAQAMIQMSADAMENHAMPISEARIAA